MKKKLSVAIFDGSNKYIDWTRKQSLLFKERREQIFGLCTSSQMAVQVNIKGKFPSFFLLSFLIQFLYCDNC